MLLYDNRGRLRLICQFYGSIYKRVAVPTLGICLYSCGLLYVLRMFDEYLPAVDHPFASQSFGTLIAFAVCFRTNIAWNRFWEACQEVTMMFSKWGDAFSQLQGFINSTIKTSKDCDVQKLEHYRCEITHLFTLLSAMAVERLTRGDIRRMQMRSRKGVPWAEQVVFRENLREKDLTGSRNLIPMRVVKVKRERRSLSQSSFITEEDASETDSDGETRAKRMAVVPSQSKISMQLKQIKDSWQMPVSIIGDLSKDELRRLRASKDRINLVLLWLNELVTNLQPLILVPPPILSRVYQELSNGTLGYSQAEKLSDIPFPFIFAQLLAVTIMFFAVISPITFTVITGDSWITPVISSGVVIAFWSLNEIAKELENPFGEDANNLPLVDAHERFVEFLVEMHGTTLPEDRAYSPHVRQINSVFSQRTTAPPKQSLGTTSIETTMSTNARTSNLSKRTVSTCSETLTQMAPSNTSPKRVFPSTYSETPAQQAQLLLPPGASSPPPHAQQERKDHQPGLCVMSSALEFSRVMDHSNSQQNGAQMQTAENLPQSMPMPMVQEAPCMPRHEEEGSQFDHEGQFNSGVDLRIDEEPARQEEQQDEAPVGQAGSPSMTSVMPNQPPAEQAVSTSTQSTSQNPKRLVQEPSTTSDQNSALGVPPSDRRLLS